MDNSAPQAAVRLLVASLDTAMGRVPRILRRRWPRAHLLLAGTPEALAHDTLEQCPDLIVVVARPWADVRGLCRLLRQLTNVPLLLAGPWDVTAHLDAGADACVPSTGSARLVQAHAAALLRRWRCAGMPAFYPSPWSSYDEP